MTLNREDTNVKKTSWRAELSFYDMLEYPYGIFAGVFCHIKRLV